MLNADVKANVVEEEIAVAQGELSSETDPERQGVLLDRLSERYIKLEEAG